jgi:hypothetical protein
MRGHDEAIEFFRVRGISTSRRVWSLGDTIVVPVGPPNEHAGITTYRDVLWLVPGADGAWDIVYLVRLFGRRLRFDSLERACEGALELLKALDPEDACPTCGGRRRLRFGERCRTSDVTWYLSTSCEACGERTEADGYGELPEDLRAIELARSGAWRVVVTSAPSTAGWSAIREALRLDVGAAMAMKHQIPGAVLETTFAQASRICALFREHGAVAEIEVD